MCGIVGGINPFDAVDLSPAALDAMLEPLRRRGPDSRGTWRSRWASLGHTRLAVIDPALGQQPMTRSLGKQEATIVYNGELYNAAELRGELEALGCRFVTRCDTEVVLYAYLAWGRRSFERLNGIFAFAVWVDAERQLTLVRDRLGVKPLFFCVVGQSLFFASETKALLRHPDVRACLDRQGVCELLLLGPSRVPGSGVLKGIEELRPGRFLTYDPAGRHSHRYWQLVSMPHRDSPRQTEEHLRELVVDAIERQLVTDVPLATLLSGGVDSSIIAAVASRYLARRGQKLTSWSVDYSGTDVHFEPSAFQESPDRPWARRVAHYLETEHSAVELSIEDTVGALNEAMRARGYPGQAEFDSSLLLLSERMKRQGYTVALSGECADEIFGGYWWLQPGKANWDCFPWLNGLDTRTSLLRRRLLSRIDAQRFVSERYQESLARVPTLGTDTVEQAQQRRSSYLAMEWFMSTLLERKDRLSMHASLEMRVPFCDHRIIEYAWNIPWEMKAPGGQPKGILRRSMRGLLPDDVLHRTKCSYPRAFNPEYGVRLASMLAAIAADPEAPLLQLCEPAALKELAGNSGEDRRWFGNMGSAQLMAFLIQTNAWLSELDVEIQLD